MVVSIRGTFSAKPDMKAEGISARSLRAPRGSAHSGISISPLRENLRNSSIETPLCASCARSNRVPYVSNAQAIASAEGPVSYGYQMAAAAAEVVSGPTCSARIVVRCPRSAKTTAQVSPETPAPTTATVCLMARVLRLFLLPPTTKRNWEHDPKNAFQDWANSTPRVDKPPFQRPTPKIGNRPSLMRAITAELS